MVFLRNISVDILHKGDTEDDDDDNKLEERRDVWASVIKMDRIIRFKKDVWQRQNICV